MNNQKGFIGLGALIAIILAVMVVGGGAYYMMHQNATPPNYPDISATEQTQIQTSNTPIATQPTTVVQPTQPSNQNNSSFSASPTSGTRGQAITFSTSYGGQNTGTAYYVDFGDNSLGWFLCGQTLPNNEQANESCMPPTFQHTYAGTGTYTYTATLHKYTGSFNDSPIVGTVKVVISGTDTLPSPTCTLTASPSTATIGQNIKISWATQNANSEGPAGYGAWVGGVGSGDLFESSDVLTQMKTPTALSGSQTITVHKAGTETLGLEINGTGGSGEGSCTVQINVSGSSTQNSGDAAASGMSMYTDASFGFSFWYPSAWVVTQVPVSPNSIPAGFYAPFNGTVVKQLQISNPTEANAAVPNNVELVEVQLPAGSFKVATAGCDTTYSYNFNSSQWMQTPSGCDGATDTPTPYTQTPNTMGGLPTLFAQAGISSPEYIVPLSATNAQHIVVVYPQGQFSNGFPTAETIVATDPTAATPENQPQRTQVVKSEQSAYAGL